MNIVLALLTASAVAVVKFEEVNGISCYVGERDSHEMRDCGADVADCVVTISHSTSGESLALGDINLSMIFI